MYAPTVLLIKVKCKKAMKIESDRDTHIEDYFAYTLVVDVKGFGFLHISLDTGPCATKYTYTATGLSLICKYPCE